MKQILALIFLIILFISCRTTHKCPLQAPQAFYVGYDSTEVDTLYIYRYQPGTNFSAIVDTVIRNEYYFYKYQHDTTIIELPNMKSISNSDNYEVFDIKVLNPFDNKQFSISEVTHSISTYTSGFGYPGIPHCISPISSFKKDSMLYANTNEVYILK